MLPSISLKSQSYRPLSHAFCLLYKNRFIYLLTDIGRDCHCWGISDTCRIHQYILTGNTVLTQAWHPTSCRGPAAVLPSVLHLIPQGDAPTAEKAASVLLRRTTGNSRGIKLLRVPAERPIYSSLHYPDNEGPTPKSSSLSSYCIFDAGVHPPQIS